MQRDNSLIYIIEDDEPIRRLYVMKFTAAGYRVEAAENGQVGLELMEKEVPDLVLLDLKMPVLDGVGFLRNVRARQWPKQVKIIILTNTNRSEAPSELRFFDISRYIVKVHHTPQQVLDIAAETLGP